jgi:hypothetical protein
MDEPLPKESNGSDPHGTRNALNYYGWGSKKAGVYQDVSFATFGEAAQRSCRPLRGRGSPPSSSRGSASILR